jgi:predicted AlkP superfamily pyrophosphatase or phosphodiesterase
LNNKILFVLLDAFRHDYINAVDTPFLHSKISKGVYAEKLKSVAGFTQRTAIYTGTTGEESGMFTMFTFDAQNSPFRFLKDDPRLERFSSKRPWWEKLPSLRGMGLIKNYMSQLFERDRQIFRQWIVREGKKYADNAPIAHIPLVLLPEIGVSEDNKPIYLPGAFEQESIFDVFVRENIKYKYLMYPVVNCQDDDVLAAFLENKNSDANILLGQFSDSDLHVHHCGPRSQKRRQITGEIDRKLREIATYYDEETTWIIIGDHGMTDITEELDVPAFLKPLEDKFNVAMGKDYLLFLDSTMARFKWITDGGRAFLTEVPRLPILLEKGTFINEQMGKEYSIPMSDRRYGDLVWWANNGVLLFPDYFHDQYTHNKGMHGYDSNHDDMKGFFLAFGPGIEPKQLGQANLIDVCPTICASVGIPAPANNKGNCLLDY